MIERPCTEAANVTVMAHDGKVMVTFHHQDGRVIERYSIAPRTAASLIGQTAKVLKWHL